MKQHLSCNSGLLMKLFQKIVRWKTHKHSGISFQRIISIYLKPHHTCPTHIQKTKIETLAVWISLKNRPTYTIAFKSCRFRKMHRTIHIHVNLKKHKYRSQKFYFVFRSVPMWPIARCQIILGLSSFIC